MKPQTIKEIRGLLKQQDFCDELNKISRYLLSDPQEITLRTLRAYESEYTSCRRDVPDWVRYVILQFEKQI